MKKSNNKDKDEEVNVTNEMTAVDVVSAATQEKDGTIEEQGSNVSIHLSGDNQSGQRSRSSKFGGSNRVKESSPNVDSGGRNVAVKRVKSNENGIRAKSRKSQKQIAPIVTAAAATTPPLKQQQPTAKKQKKYGRRGPPLLQPSTRLNNHYVIIQMFAGGGFGQVYRAFDEERQISVAVKVEPKDHDPGRIILEQNILAQLKGTPNAPSLFASGSIGNNNYLVMEILGSNLSDIRKKYKSQSLSLGSALRVTLQALTALRTLHGIGFVHRDVKPSNFCIGFSGAHKRIIYLVDFGLSRQFRDAKGKLRRKRKVAAFRGTLKYVSINVHSKKEQGPVDDFISLFYTGFELAEGSLPWRYQKDVLMVEQMKRNFKYQDYAKVLPSTFQKFYDYLLPLTYRSPLNYEYLQQIIKDCLPAEINDKTPYDWEEVATSDAGTMD